MTKEFIKNFWARVKKCKSGCWEWTGYCTKYGHGMLSCRSISKIPLYVHRIAWILKRGDPKKLHVLHDCDNPRCVNPKHLFLGTQVDNNNDRIKKGRTASGDKNGARTQRHRNPFVRNRGSGCRGEKHPMAVLSIKKVREIRELSRKGIRNCDIAIKYGTSQQNVWRIVKGIIWKEDGRAKNLLR